MKRIARLILMGVLLVSPVVAMDGFLKQSTSVNVLVLLVNSSDHISGITGLTLTIKASKAAGAFSTITPTVTEREAGYYQLALDANHTNTPGQLVLHITAAGADPAGYSYQVSSYLPGEQVSLQDDAITAAKIATDAIGTAELANSCITTLEIADATIGSSKFAPGAITAAAIAADAIGASEIAAGAIVKGTEATGWNDLSAAQVKAEVDMALADYDGPTNAELDARTLPSAEYGTAANQTTLLGRLTDTRAGYLDYLAHFFTMIELDGLVYRYTANALEEGAGGGGGGGGSAAETWEYQYNGKPMQDFINEIWKRVGAN